MAGLTATIDPFTGGGPIINGVMYPSSDAFTGSNGQQYVMYNGQTYSLGANGAMSPVSSSQSSGGVNYSQLLPNASQYESFAPQPYQSFGSVPYVQAATVNPASVASTPAMQAAQQSPVAAPSGATVGSVGGPNAASVDLSQMPGALSSYESEVSQALSPTFKQQQDSLNASLADRGIYNSTAGQQLQNDLTGQQDAALASAYEPLISQFAGAYTTGEEQNAAQRQAANLAGYQGDLSSAQLNAEQQQAAELAGYQGTLDTGSLNTQLEQEAATQNYGGTQGVNELVAQLEQQAALENQAAMNTANTTNASTYNNVITGNTTDYNNYLNELLQAQYGTGTTLLNDVIGTYDPSIYSSLLNTGLGQAGSAYTNAYSAGEGNTANLSSTLGNLATQLATKPAGTASTPAIGGSSALQFDQPTAGNAFP